MTARFLLTCTMHGHSSALVEDCIQLMGVIQQQDSCSLEHCSQGICCLYQLSTPNWKQYRWQRYSSQSVLEMTCMRLAAFNSKCPHLQGGLWKNSTNAGSCASKHYLEIPLWPWTGLKKGSFIGTRDCDLWLTCQIPVHIENVLTWMGIIHYRVAGIKCCKYYM